MYSNPHKSRHGIIHDEYGTCSLMGTRKLNKQIVDYPSIVGAGSGIEVLVPTSIVVVLSGQFIKPLMTSCIAMWTRAHTTFDWSKMSPCITMWTIGFSYLLVQLTKGDYMFYNANKDSVIVEDFMYHYELDII